MQSLTVFAILQCVFNVYAMFDVHVFNFVTKNLGHNYFDKNFGESTRDDSLAHG